MLGDFTCQTALQVLRGAYSLQETACFSGRYSTEVADPEATRMKRSGFVGINSAVSSTTTTWLALCMVGNSKQRVGACAKAQITAYVSCIHALIYPSVLCTVPDCMYTLSTLPWAIVHLLGFTQHCFTLPWWISWPHYEPKLIMSPVKPKAPPLLYENAATLVEHVARLSALRLYIVRCWSKALQNCYEKPLHLQIQMHAAPCPICLAFCQLEDQ